MKKLIVEELIANQILHFLFEGHSFTITITFTILNLK